MADQVSKNILLIPSVENGDTVDSLTDNIVGGEKVLSVVLEITLSGSKTHNARLRDAHEAIVGAAVRAVANAILGDVKSVTSRVTYGYRHMESELIKWDVPQDEPNITFK